MNLTRRRFSLGTRIHRRALALGPALMLTGRLAANGSDEVIDFRFAPPVWQTAICLPDDWQKTLVGKDGSLLYDYPGKHGGFGTRILFRPDSKTEWVRQELASPRVPIVRTIQRCGSLEIVQEAFAAAPAPAPPTPPGAFVIERVGAQTGQRAWASPPAGADPAFANVAIGWNQPIHYRFRDRDKAAYTVAFGLCEGWHKEPGQRILQLYAEGHSPRTIDPVQETGRNRPQVYKFTARDENHDGWIDLTVSVATNSSDRNTILNTLWVFAGSVAPSSSELVYTTSTQKPLIHLDCSEELAPAKPPRKDILLVRIRNRGTPERTVDGKTEVIVRPTLLIETERKLELDDSKTALHAGAATAVISSEQLESSADKNALFCLPPVRVPPQAEKTLAFAIVRGKETTPKPLTVRDARTARQKAERYWRNLKLPYDRLRIPDEGIQALLDSSVRNIYQAREIKNDLPAFQVGPTCYRGLWVVDGSFLLEAITYLDRARETRSGIEYLLSFQRPDGGFMLLDGHWKETGIVLWAITRHAKLTGDKAWLRSVWPRLERGFAFIRHLRTLPPEDALNARLLPDGFSDGGLADKVPEYTNIYWTLAGIRAAIEAARWLGNEAEANDWQKEYDDFLQTFRRAAERDLRQDATGNSYLPIRMKWDPAIPPQKAQWAFLHAVFPGKVFADDDPLVRGNMAMLRSVECEGLVQDTGWLKDGIWNYFGSFYAHAWLWLGNGAKAAQTLYNFGNHASPLLAWREEQMPVRRGDQFVGDMPHNWASAEFIRLVRHSLILERGPELHLFEAVPHAWLKPGARIQATEIATEFGPISIDMKASRDGSEAVLSVSPPQRKPPERLWLHLDGWSAESGLKPLPANRQSRTTIRLR